MMISICLIVAGDFLIWEGMGWKLWEEIALTLPTGRCEIFSVNSDLLC